MIRRLVVGLMVGCWLVSGPPAAAGPAGHVVISEVQTHGETGHADDEFIELYNPTDSNIDLSSWSIQYRSGGSSSFEKKNFESDDWVPANGFFLIANSHGVFSSSADMAHATFSLRADGATVFLVQDDDYLSTGTESTIVDKVAYDGTGTLFPEGNPANAPSANESIERKAFASSTLGDMISGGSHAKFGNSYDSDNNAGDFILRDTSDPQNSSSSIERCCTTVEGTITLQGRDTYSGVSLLMWPGEGLQAGTDDAGTFSIANVPAIAGADTDTYTVEVTVDSYLLPRNSLDLTTKTDAGGVLLPTVTLPAIRLLGGDINKDNRINIQDLARIGSKYDQSGSFAEDINGDGQVNIQDLAIAAGNFGQDTLSAYGIWPEE